MDEDDKTLLELLQVPDFKWTPETLQRIREHYVPRKFKVIMTAAHAQEYMETYGYDVTKTDWIEIRDKSTNPDWVWIQFDEDGKSPPRYHQGGFASFDPTALSTMPTFGFVGNEGAYQEYAYQEYAPPPQANNPWYRRYAKKR